MVRQEQSIQDSPREPDIYHNPKEMIWKSLALNAYYKITRILGEVDALSDPEIQGLRTKVLDVFNGNHSQDIFCERAEVLLQRLNGRLNTIGRSEIYNIVAQEIQASRSHINESLQIFNRTGLVYPIREQTHVEDGTIEIAGMSIEEFSRQKDYFSATLRLFSEENDQYRAIAESSFHQGFVLDYDEKRLVARTKQQNWEVVDLVTQQLLNQQTAKRYKSLQAYEYLPEGNQEDNGLRKQDSLKEAYYFMGKIFSIIAHYSNESGSNEVTSSETRSDPVAMFLHASGKDTTPQQLIAVMKVALAHSSHGLNSGELTAQLAGSVRTTFPRALIASFNIRSGILHAGAISKCMRQTKNYLDGHEDPEAYINGLLKKGEKLYGFGHRIHKTNADDAVDMLGKDPRVALYINACLEGFPKKSEEINRLVKYVSTIRKMRPSLGANTDFGASVLFHSLDLPSNAASGFFLAFRTPGVCAQVVNELSVKGNSRRPPFPPVLPY